MHNSAHRGRKVEYYLSGHVKSHLLPVEISQPDELSVQGSHIRACMSSATQLAETVEHFVTAWSAEVLFSAE